MKAEMTYTRAMILSAILLLGLVFLVYMHETVHVMINERYDMESRVEWFSHFPNVVTIADKPCPTDSCILAHHINEAVTYPLQVIYFVIAMYLQATWVFELNDKRKKNEG